jgi:lipopolysaccharide export system permease protein
MATVILFINEQHFLPYALKKLNYLESIYLHKGEGVGEINERVSVKLKDGSRLFFESIDAKEMELFDVWYVPNWQMVWHLERLNVADDVPKGYFVDHFHRDDTGEFVHIESMPTHVFEMDFVFDDLMEMVSAPATQSITELMKMAGEKRGVSEQQEVVSALLSKLFLPWLALLAAVAPIPFSITFSRKSPFFLIYFFSIFGLLAFYLLIKAAIIIANASVVAPFVAIGIPFIVIMLILGTCTLRFIRYGSV